MRCYIIMPEHLERDIWTGSTLGGLSAGLIVWAMIVGTIPNSWYRKNSAGVVQWMGMQVLERFLREPFVMPVYWTNTTMLLHNLYFMMLAGLVFGVIVAGMTVLTIRKVNGDRRAR